MIESLVLTLTKHYLTRNNVKKNISLPIKFNRNRQLIFWWNRVVPVSYLTIVTLFFAGIDGAIVRFKICLRCDSVSFVWSNEIRTPTRGIAMKRILRSTRIFRFREDLLTTEMCHVQLLQTANTYDGQIRLNGYRNVFFFFFWVWYWMSSITVLW